MRSHVPLPDRTAFPAEPLSMISDTTRTSVLLIGALAAFAAVVDTAAVLAAVEAVAATRGS